MSARWHLRLAAVAASIGIGAVACSEGSVLGVVGSEDEDAAAPAPISGEDASSSELADAGPVDSGIGDELDADVEDSGTGKRCTDEGWCHVIVPDNQTLRALWGDGQGTVWTVSDEGNILRWNGTAWVKSYAAGVPLYAIWGSGPTDLWAGGGATPSGNTIEPGVLLHGTGPNPSSITWTKVTTEVTIRSIWGTSATDVYAVASVPHRVDNADPSYLLHYAGPSGSGFTVDPLSTELPAHFDAVWGTSADDIWVSGRVRTPSAIIQGKVAHRVPTGDGGSSWRTEQPAHTPISETKNEMFGFSVSPTQAYLVGFTSDLNNTSYVHIGVSNGAGAPFTWTRTLFSTGPITPNGLTAAWAASPSEFWLAGQFGRLRRWDGLNWRLAAVSLDGRPVQKAIHAIWGSGPDDIWAVGAGIALHKVAQ